MGKRIDDTMCYCLKMRRSAENVISFYDNILSSSKVTARQFSLLNAILNNCGCTIKVLSQKTLLDRSTLARSLNPLFKAGYIKDDKPEGTRNSVLKLTKEGKIVCKRAFELWEKAQKQFETKLTKEKLAVLEDLLTILQDL